MGPNGRQPNSFELSSRKVEQILSLEFNFVLNTWSELRKDLNYSKTNLESVCKKAFEGGGVYVTISTNSFVLPRRFTDFLTMIPSFKVASVHEKQ